MIPDSTNNTQKFHALIGTETRVAQINSTGGLEAVVPFVTGKLADSTAINLLIDDSNWNNAGVYIGTTISGTYEGQYYDDGDFFYTAYSDNIWKRIPLSASASGMIINKLDAKTTPTDADMVGLMNSASSSILNKLSWANIKTALNAVYAQLTGATFTGEIVGTTIKAQVKRTIQSTTSTATFTHNCDSYDAGKITAQAAGLTMAAPSGTAYDMQTFLMHIKDNGTARAISWNAVFASMGATLPTTTVISKWTKLLFMYSADSSKWELMSLAQET